MCDDGVSWNILLIKDSSRFIEVRKQISPIEADSILETIVAK